MSFIDWNDNFSVHVPLFDEEHKKLVQMTNTLYDAIKQGKGKDALSPLLKELTLYVSTHFTHEECAMQKCNYPDLDAHKKARADFIKKVSDYTRMHLNGSLTANQLLSALREWLIYHICNIDKDYAPFLSKEQSRFF